MAKKSLTHFLGFLVLLLGYMLYEQTQERKKLYELSVDADFVIKDLTQAIESQKIYIKQLETSYNIIYNKYYYEQSPLQLTPRASD